MLGTQSGYHADLAFKKLTVWGWTTRCDELGPGCCDGRSHPAPGSWRRAGPALWTDGCTEKWPCEASSGRQAGREA